jgi:hypothetical protein
MVRSADDCRGQLLAVRRAAIAASMLLRMVGSADKCRDQLAARADDVAGNLPRM